MDFDVSKENIQPLRGGRNPSQLGAALQAQSNTEIQRELMQQKENFEKLIETYTGDDPLENWYTYISWVEQSFPKHGHEGNLVPLLEHCLKIFESDERYADDRRLCKLLIKYIDLQPHPVELYHMMYARGLCKGCTDMYKAWAYYYEATGDFQNANRVLECAKIELAQPYDELEVAIKNLVMAAGQHMIYGPDEQGLSEKRQALTSLRTYKAGKVGSIRAPSGSGAGTLKSAGVAPRSNVPLMIYEDHGDEIRGAEAAPISILSAAKRQEVRKENTLKPGPWTTVPIKKRHTDKKSGPSFTVHEDSGDSSDRLKLHEFPTETLEKYTDWLVSLTIPEVTDARMVPMYPKRHVYSQVGSEFSLEELRAMRYNSQRNRLQVAPVETSLAVQSILGDSNKVKLEQNLHGSIQTPNFGEQNPQSFSALAFVANDPTKESVPEWNKQSTPQIFSPAVRDELDIWGASPDALHMIAPKSAKPKFEIYEQSNLGLQEHIEPKGSAMKTPFKDWNAEELAETGSRGGMDVAAAGPVDGAKSLPIYEDDSSNSFEKVPEPENCHDLSCNTQMFNFNLNVMQVSTPQPKVDVNMIVDSDSAKLARKQLFSENNKVDSGEKILSTILEETKSYGSSSSSSGTNTKFSSYSLATRPNNMATISEEHNSYLAQNLMANAELRLSLLGNLMNLDQPTEPPQQPMQHEDIMQYEQQHTVPKPATVDPLNFVPSDPFKQRLIQDLLQRVRFPGPHTQGYYLLSNTPRLAARKETLNIGADKYVIEKQLGKGQYGTVFRGVELRTGNTVALKYQKPANKWEFYICRELQSRLGDHPLKSRFMDIKIGYFSDLASILVSDFFPCGSLLDVANVVKQKLNRPMKESLCIHFCLEMLKVVQAMHEVKIIHADIKPDNFLVQLIGDTVGLQLIDFGCSIDMTLFPPGTSFKRRVTTEDFVCCEMIDGKPWNYHTDLFCVAATAHVLLFEKYIQMRKKDGHWSISNRLPRYARLDLWNMFFSTLLNQPENPVDSVSITLQAMLDDSLNHKFDDYHSDMRCLINVLKNR